MVSTFETEEVTHAIGDCGTCDIAKAFEFGPPYSKINIRICTLCQEQQRPQKFALLSRKFALLSRLEEEVKARTAEIEENAKFFAKRMGLLEVVSASSQNEGVESELVVT